MTRTAAGLDARWAAWRDRRPPFDGTHVDCAAAGRMSRAVVTAVGRHLQREAEIGAYPAEAEAGALIAAGRTELATLLDVPADGVAFVDSAAGALRALLSAWPLPEQASVAVAPGEWGPNLQAFRGRGLAVHVLTVDGDGVVDLDALRSVLHAGPPSAVHLDHVAAHTGVVQPVADVLTLCREAGVPLWLDAAQALGHVNTAVGADALYATSRKWLCGPRGVGILAIAPRWWGELRAEPYPLDPERPPAQRLEPSEATIAGRVGLGAAVGEYKADGALAIQERLCDVGRMTRETLAQLQNWEVLDAGEHGSAIVALRPRDGQDVTDVRRRLLDTHRLLTTASLPVRAPLDAHPALLRLSPHVDSTAADIDHAAAALATH